MKYKNVINGIFVRIKKDKNVDKEIFVCYNNCKSSGLEAYS